MVKEMQLCSFGRWRNHTWTSQTRLFAIRKAIFFPFLTLFLPSGIVLDPSPSTQILRILQGPHFSSMSQCISEQMHKKWKLPVYRLAFLPRHTPWQQESENKYLTWREWGRPMPGSKPSFCSTTTSFVPLTLYSMLCQNIIFFVTCQ